jgi:hypothetical protein
MQFSILLGVLVPIIGLMLKGILVIQFKRIDSPGTPYLVESSFTSNLVF